MKKLKKVWRALAVGLTNRLKNYSSKKRRLVIGLGSFFILLLGALTYYGIALAQISEAEINLAALREDINNDGVADYDPDYFNASPINHAKADVPLLLIHGNLDNTVPPSQSRNLLTKIRSLGGVCDLIIYNCGHFSDPGLATERYPIEPIDVNSGIAYSKGATGLDAMFMFFHAML